MKFLESIKVKFAISRIIKMEKIFDDLKFSFEKSKEEFYKNKNLQRKLKVLTNYYENGKWLKDYQLDEENLLPKTLKRGILSQDGIYNFLSEVESREV
ncbi:MAG: DUF4298 domain-containing protein [Spirochaetaceae bacterium]|nr:DUF4298 domain-containing protein [Spirochaetaceae bacterium]